MHTKDMLAAALLEIGLEAMATKAAAGYVHDFLSPLAMPEMQLAEDLAGIGTPEAVALRQRVINGDFDASREESCVGQSRGARGIRSVNSRNRAERRKAGERGNQPKPQPMGRLALREEGDFWNAYYAMPDTMDGALLLGSFHMKLAMSRPERKAGFMSLMRAAVADLIEDKFGTRPMWPDAPAPAPEHERRQ